MFHVLARQRESSILEGHLCKDHVHMYIAIPPKYAVAQVVGFIKGKSAIHIAREVQGRARNFSGQNFWARGYFVSTVGRDCLSKVETSGELRARPSEGGRLRWL